MGAPVTRGVCLPAVGLRLCSLVASTWPSFWSSRPYSRDWRCEAACLIVRLTFLRVSLDPRQTKSLPETWPPRAPSDRVPLCPFSAQTVVTMGAGDHSWVDRIVRHSSGLVRDGLPARATVSGSSLSPQVSRDLAGSPLGPDFRGPLPRAWATPTPKHCRTGAPSATVACDPSDMSRLPVS